MADGEAVRGRDDAAAVSRGEAVTGRGELPGTQPANVPAASAPNTPRSPRRDQAAVAGPPHAALSMLDVLRRICEPRVEALSVSDALWVVTVEPFGVGFS